MDVPSNLLSNHSFKSDLFSGSVDPVLNVKVMFQKNSTRVKWTTFNKLLWSFFKLKSSSPYMLSLYGKYEPAHYSKYLLMCSTEEGKSQVRVSK